MPYSRQATLTSPHEISTAAHHCTWQQLVDMLEFWQHCYRLGAPITWITGVILHCTGLATMVSWSIDVLISWVQYVGILATLLQVESTNHLDSWGYTPLRWACFNVKMKEWWEWQLGCGIWWYRQHYYRWRLPITWITVDILHCNGLLTMVRQKSDNNDKLSVICGNTGNTATHRNTNHLITGVTLLCIGLATNDK